MSLELQEETVALFLKEILTPENELKQSELSSSQSYSDGGRFFNVYGFKDESLWVMGNLGIERFLGYVYLKKAIEHYNLKNLCVAETKFIFKKEKGDVKANVIPSTCTQLQNVIIPVIHSSGVYSLSRYMGDDRISSINDEENKELIILEKK